MSSRALCSLIVVLGAMLLGGCSSVELGPNSAANEKARASIEAGGGDPDDWRVVNGCAAMGPCAVQLSPAARPGLVVARNLPGQGQLPWPLGIDEIRATVARAERAAASSGSSRQLRSPAASRAPELPGTAATAGGTPPPLVAPQPLRD
ncbi:MAG: hypothetical protein R2700_11680 [Solirubrobacterales bacterium]